MKWMIMLLGCALVGMGNQGCDGPQTNTLEVTPRVSTTNQLATEFTVTSKGFFQAGYDNSTREIFILKDNKTGKEYLGITDCTLIKRIEQKKEDAADAIETGVDAAIEVITE